MRLTFCTVAHASGSWNLANRISPFADGQFPPPPRLVIPNVPRGTLGLPKLAMPNVPRGTLTPFLLRRYRRLVTVDRTSSTSWLRPRAGSVSDGWRCENRRSRFRLGRAILHN